MKRIGEEQKMTVKEVAAALCVSERVIQKHASEMGLTTNGKQTTLDEKAVTIIKKKIELSGRTDLAHVCELPNINTDLEMMVLDAKVSEWKTRKIEGAVYTSIRIDAEAWECIPKPKAAYVRQAVKEKLERDEVEARR